MSHITRGRRESEDEKYVRENFPMGDNISTPEELVNSMELEEKIPCVICGDDTNMLGTKKCDGCWNLMNSFQMLRMRSPESSNEFLIRRLEEWKTISPDHLMRLKQIVDKFI